MVLVIMLILCTTYALGQVCMPEGARDSVHLHVLKCVWANTTCVHDDDGGSGLFYVFEQLWEKVNASIKKEAKVTLYQLEHVLTDLSTSWPDG